MTDYYTCSCSGDGESPSFFDRKTVKARKTHWCCECREEIKPGDKYERVVGKWDGDFDSYATCTTCARVRVSVIPCAVFGALWEELRDCYFEREDYDADIDWLSGEPQ